MITDVWDIADTLAKESANKSSSDNYTQNFQNHKKTEKTKLNFSSNNKEDYNQPFSKAELESAISKSQDSSPGPDDSFSSVGEEQKGDSNGARRTYTCVIARNGAQDMRRNGRP